MAAKMAGGLKEGKLVFSLANKRFLKTVEEFWIGEDGERTV